MKSLAREKVGGEPSSPVGPGTVDGGPKREAGARKGMPQAWTSPVQGLKLPIHGAGVRWEAPPAPVPPEGADPPLGPWPRRLFLVR